MSDSPESHHTNTQDSAPQKRSLFGRRQGRPLSPSRQHALDTLLPELEIPRDQLTQDHTLSPDRLFARPMQEYWLEIGFGYGEHMATLSRANTNNGYIGVEPFINGMAAFLKDIEEDWEGGTHDNLRVLMDDGMIAARSLTPSSLNGIYVLNPDPWHKKRHHKRRIINQDNLEVFARILKPGGTLVMTTDVPDLAEWMCTHTSHHPAFSWTAKSRNDFFVPPKNWVQTRYEIKGAKGAKKMVYLFFTRKHD